MRIQIFSDLHTDVAPTKPIKIGADVDVIVAAGDTAEGARNAFEALRRFVPARVPIVMVMGNHEFYRRTVPDELAIAREAAPSFNVHLLENEAVTIGGGIGGVRFAGCTLWTDYQVFGAANAAAAMNAARSGLNDHRLINWSKQPWLRFRPEEALLLHTRSKAFLTAIMARPFDGPSVIVAHHGHWRSVPPQYQTDILTAAFASDLTALFDPPRGVGGASARPVRAWPHPLLVRLPRGANPGALQPAWLRRREPGFQPVADRRGRRMTITKLRKMPRTPRHSPPVHERSRPPPALAGHAGHLLSGQ
ncbi:metallophosphoesterase family protein [Rhodopseudomonas pseudopalustris]|uniref:metallophosphoesterase n=1 Tax=Rhodopseudomonas pseudopalustris TaxID=1513892 RepID=UPI003F9C40B1